MALVLPFLVIVVVGPHDADSGPRLTREGL